MKIRALLLDKDGTLLDYARTWVPINRGVALFASGGDPLLADQLLLAGGHDPETDIVTAGTVLAAGSIADIAGVFAGILGPRVPRGLETEIERLFREGGAQHSVLIDGVEEAIRQLAGRGYRLGIATNDSIGGLESSLGRHRGFLDRFEFLTGCDSGHGVKPLPGMVHAFCEATGCEPSEVAVVGDAVHDLEMGRRASAGLKIGVLSGTSVRGDLEPFADAILDSIRELAVYLDE